MADANSSNLVKSRLSYNESYRRAVDPMYENIESVSTVPISNQFKNNLGKIGYILFSVGYIIFIAAIFIPRWCIGKDDNLPSLIKDDFKEDTIKTTILLFDLCFGIFTVVFTYIINEFMLYPVAWSESSNILFLGILWILSTILNYCILGSLKTCDFGFSYYAGWLGSFMMLFGGIMIVCLGRLIFVENDDSSEIPLDSLESLRMAAACEGGSPDLLTSTASLGSGHNYMQSQGPPPSHNSGSNQNQILHYIATQGPKNSTIGDFWSMIRQQAIEIIIMITELHDGKKEKCAIYWPKNLNETKVWKNSSGEIDIKVQLLEEDAYKSIDGRTIFYIEYIMKLTQGPMAKSQ